MDYAALGARIRQKRMQMGWTQEALAKEIGMSTSFIGHIERGSRAASVETLVQISNAMSVSLDDLLVDNLTWKEEALPQDISTLSDKERAVLNQVLGTLQKTLSGWGQDAQTPES